ncbi:sensor histidine kinase KdpD [Bacteriovorax sp. Seq25_V]|uniref:sensor histidine kinase n=1 Tax=Bacteriovorax sp. Seq25_V TaxID=1201288 RepID=UPI000389DF48|nr:HAMP domain-containing sensor histidine kinase [Bacteriovorax sp. Seq25_V]EQC43985.1 GHKL domain protein [Bacteriovorax sp. Seq25_V]
MNVEEQSNYRFSGQLRDRDQEALFKEYYWQQSKKHFFVSYNICCILLLFAGIFFDFHRTFYWGSANILIGLRLILVFAGLLMFPLFYKKVHYPKAIEEYGFFLMLLSTLIIILLTLMTRGNSFTLMPGILIMTCSFYIVTPAPLLYAFISSTLLLVHYIFFFNFELVGLNAHIYMCFMLCAINIVLIYIKIVQSKSQRASFLAQEYLKELGYAKDTILSLIGHDLKNPLTVIKSRVEILKKSLENDDIERANKQVESINSASDNLNGLLQNLLEWAISIKSSNAKNESNCVQNACANAIDFCEDLAIGKSINIESTIHPLKFCFNQLMLETVIRNLIANSIKYSFENSKISVTGEILGSQYKITVKDEGIGIDEDFLEELRKGVNNRTSLGTQGEHGHGVGLKLVFHLLQSHQCDIDINSTKDAGSKFSVFLPII